MTILLQNFRYLYAYKTDLGSHRQLIIIVGLRRNLRRAHIWLLMRYLNNVKFIFRLNNSSLSSRQKRMRDGVLLASRANVA